MRRLWSFAVIAAFVLALPTVASSTASHRAARFVSGNSGFAGLRASFEHSLICDNGVLIAAYAKAYGITTIFVPVSGDDITSLINANPTTVKNLQAMTAVASVYLVTGDPTWLASPTVVPPDAASVSQIAKKYAHVAGVLYNVDPEAAAGWNSSGRKSIIDAYFQLVATLQAGPGSTPPVTYYLAHPDFATLSAGTGSTLTMLARLQSAPAYGGTVMLVPGNSAQAQETAIAPAIPELTLPFIIEASASKYSNNSYYGQSASYLNTNLSALAQNVAAQNGNLISVEVNGWNDLYNGLQSILAQPPTFNGVLAGGPLVPPAGSAYLGAFANTQGTGASQQQIALLESQIGRTVAFNLHFYGWQNAFPGPLEADDAAHGRIPVIAWNCGDTDVRVASGADDAAIIARAQAIKAFGTPIMLRWFWEMNLDDTNDPPRKKCYDPTTDFPNGYFSPIHYINAWSHIRAVFAAQGVTNVIWLWCVANAHGGPSQYYPGDGEVDWVGMDDYDTNDVAFPDTFSILANELSQFQEKPLMITETGAHAAVQPAFFNGSAQTLQSTFPIARAIGYLDSTGTHQNWILSQPGLQAFTAFAQSPYLSAKPFARTGGLLRRRLK